MEKLKLDLQYTWLNWTLAFVGVLVLLFFLVQCVKDKNNVLLAFRNVLRNKRRTIITLIAVSFAFVGNVLLGIYFLHMYSGLRESTIRSQTGHLQIMKTDFLDYGMSSPGEYLIDNYQEILATIAEDEELRNLIDLSMKEVIFNGIISSGLGDKSLNYLGRGVEVEEDQRLAIFDIYFAGGPLKKDNPYGIILGEGLAKQLEVELDDRLTLLGTLHDGGINVLDASLGGILQAMSKDYGNVIVKTSLEYAQEMVGSDGVNKIILLLHETSNTLIGKHRIETILKANPHWGVEVYDWQEIIEFYVQVHTLFSTIYIIVSSLLFGLVIFLVVNTMTMSIYERFSEFGTLRAIGATRYKLIELIVIEGIILGIIGIGIGLFFTWIIGYIPQLIGIEVPAPPGQSRGYPLDLRLRFMMPGFVKLVLMSFTSIVGITFLSSMIPAIRVAKLKIIEAIHSI